MSAEEQNLNAPPMNQFGTVSQSDAPNPFGTPSPFDAQVPSAGWGTPIPPKKTRSAAWVMGVGVLVTLAIIGVLGRLYIFPDLSKTISLPATVAGLPQGSGSPNGVTARLQTDKGHAIAMSIYADNPVRPTQFAMIMAIRGGDKEKNFELPSAKPQSTTKTGKYTCTREWTSAEILRAPADAQQILAASGFTSGAACWRTSRHFTTMAMAFGSAGSTNSVALQAAIAGWNAR